MLNTFQLSCFWKLIFVIYTVQTTVSTESIFDWKLNSSIENYIEDLTKHSQLDFTLVLTKAQYYDDYKHSIKRADSIAFVSRPKNASVEQFLNLTSLSDNNANKVDTEAEDKGLLLSVENVKINKRKKQKNAFSTKPLVPQNSVAEKVALNKDGFDAGITAQIHDMMDSTEHVGTLQVFDYFPNGNVKRKTTSIAYPKKITIKGSHGMSQKWKDESKKLLRKAYKVNTEDRAPIIADLFEQKYPKYTWQVFVNSSAYSLNRDVLITLHIGNDEYDVAGVTK